MCLLDLSIDICGILNTSHSLINASEKTMNIPKSCLDLFHLSSNMGKIQINVDARFIILGILDLFWGFYLEACTPSQTGVPIGP